MLPDPVVLKKDLTLGIPGTVLLILKGENTEMSKF